MANTFLLRMPSGIPGDVSRKDNLLAEPRKIGATPPAAYGLAVSLDPTTDSLLAFDNSLAAYGFLIRPYPIQSTTDAQGSAAPVANFVGDVMRRGYMTVVNNEGTPTTNGQVYIRYDNEDATHPLGGVEAALVSGETIALTGCTFMGAADELDNVEISFNI